MGTAQTKANNKYKAKTYDRIEVIVSKGLKEVISNHANSQGESLNGYITKAITQRMERDNA